MQLIVASDIFGKTPELESLVSEFSTKYSKTFLLDPYDGKELDFNSEKEAYSYFKKTIGLIGYIETILRTAAQNQAESHLLGFSVGASAIWAILQDDIFHPKTKAICFYGSQIRNLLNINPLIETDLYFPESEAHFDVSGVIDRVTQNANVRCFRTGYLHGFMNRRSVNFDETGYSEYMQIIKTFG